MDISQLKTAKSHSEGAVLRVVSPSTGKKTDLELTLRGVDSIEFRLAEKRIRNSKLNRMAEGDKDSEEQQIADELDLAVAVTIGWSGIESDGEPLQFSESAARSLYTDAPWIVSQIDRFISRRKNFIKG